MARQLPQLPQLPKFTTIVIGVDWGNCGNWRAINKLALQNQQRRPNQNQNNRNKLHS